ncbi:hypothetical protein ABW636_13205 [Aquimarina sp. 2201CG1-2-11]|uniref:hypothetical protein n=1 Tax=Aquimarina discodermiae TaxID=3231043 RepID=UPI003462FE1F
MKNIIWIFLFVTNISLAQKNEKFLMDFLLEDQLKSENVLSNYNKFDFTKLWIQTKNHNVFGIIGIDHQRIRVKIISIEKSLINPNEYLIKGKSLVKETICDFDGTITLKEIKEVQKLHFGVDNQYESKGIKSQGILIADFKFNENVNQKHSGVFKGQLYSKWYLTSDNQINYDNIQSIADGYSNNAYIGIWKSYKTGKEKICNWADFRVPNANQDFDIGAGEFSVSEKYWNKGWLDIALENQAPNGAIVREKSEKEAKEWWK